VKEDVGKNQEEIFSPCHTYSKYEEYIINRGMLFFFNCEKCGHLEIQCHEGNETKKLSEKEENYEA
jgi:translation initiation factor 2 beta subunit (eIF-2beta)/eIF-5